MPGGELVYTGLNRDGDMSFTTLISSEQLAGHLDDSAWVVVDCRQRAAVGDAGCWRIGRFRPEETVHMCGSGVTACHNLLAMEIAGLAGLRPYAGSWSEWILDPDRPVVKGA